jgi:transcriptional regulator with XRE-family HTH domain
MPWASPSEPDDLADVRLVLGRAIRDLRSHHGLTQVALEERSGLDQTVISRLETGRDVKLRLTRLLVLFRVLGVDRIALQSRYEGATIAGFMSRRTRNHPRRDAIE